MTKEESIKEAKQALKDIGHWEKFNYFNSKFLKDGMYDYPCWLVWFEHTEDDYKKGIVSPTIIISEIDGRVKRISWSRSHFFIKYDEIQNKYHHPRLSREQPKLD